MVAMRKPTTTTASIHHNVVSKEISSGSKFRTQYQMLMQPSGSCFRNIKHHHTHGTIFVTKNRPAGSSKHKLNPRRKMPTLRLMRSLLIIVLVYVSSWAATMTIIFLVTAMHMSQSVVFHASMYVGILANVNVGCNFYIYYLRSQEYRRAFNGVLFCCLPTFRTESSCVSNDCTTSGRLITTGGNNIEAVLDAENSV